MGNLPYHTAYRAFFKSNEDAQNINGECICKGIVRIRNIKCTRKVRNGTNYCGFHKSQDTQQKSVARAHAGAGPAQKPPPIKKPPHSEPGTFMNLNFGRLST